MWMRGLLAGVLMLVVGALSTWMLGGLLERRAEAAHGITASDIATTTADRTHWMF
jgi:hypothetical protein